MLGGGQAGGQVERRALTAGRGGAGLTGSVPGPANVVGAAAHPPGHVQGQLVLTRAVIVPGTHTLSHVYSQHQRGEEWVGSEEERAKQMKSSLMDSSPPQHTIHILAFLGQCKT